MQTSALKIAILLNVAEPLNSVLQNPCLDRATTSLFLVILTQHELVEGLQVHSLLG